MANNWCKNVVLLYKRDPSTGNKEVIRAFSSLKSAKKWRRIYYADEALRKNLDLNDTHPIERWDVTFQSEF